MTEASEQAIGQAIQALESAETSAILSDATWWTDLTVELENTQRAGQELSLAVLVLLTNTLMETLQPLRQGVLDLTPNTLKTMGRALKKWAALRATLSASPLDDETNDLLHSLGSEEAKKRKP